MYHLSHGNNISKVLFGARSRVTSVQVRFYTPQPERVDILRREMIDDVDKDKKLNQQQDKTQESWNDLYNQSSSRSSRDSVNSNKGKEMKLEQNRESENLEEFGKGMKRDIKKMDKQTEMKGRDEINRTDKTTPIFDQGQTMTPTEEYLGQKSTDKLNEFGKGPDYRFDMDKEQNKSGKTSREWKSTDSMTEDHFLNENMKSKKRSSDMKADSRKKLEEKETEDEDLENISTTSRMSSEPLKEKGEGSSKMNINTGASFGAPDVKKTKQNTKQNTKHNTSTRNMNQNISSSVEEKKSPGISDDRSHYSRGFPKADNEELKNINNDQIKIDMGENIDRSPKMSGSSSHHANPINNFESSKDSNAKSELKYTTNFSPEPVNGGRMDDKTDKDKNLFGEKDTGAELQKKGDKKVANASGDKASTSDSPNMRIQGIERE